MVDIPRSVATWRPKEAVGRTAIVALPLGASLIVVCYLMAGPGQLMATMSTSNQVSRKLLANLFVDTKEGELEPLFPLETIDYLGISCAIVGLILAAGGGIGGGGLLVPIFLLVMEFPVKHAVSLSNVTVFGGAVANTLLNSRKKHPLANRPLIDFDVLSMMEPLTMAGALIGADLNEILPDVLVVIMLVVLLGATALRTLDKANRLYASETAVMESEAIPDSETKTLMTDRGGSYGSKSSNTSSYSDEESPVKSIELTNLLVKESKTDWSMVLKVILLFISTVLLNLIKGSGGELEWFPFEVRCGSITFYALEFASLLILIVFVGYVRRKLIADTNYKDSIGYAFVKGDIRWDPSNTLFYSSICSVAGLFAGLFGIGGGIVKGPLMLEMGVHPSVASATSATMILFTSFTATTSYMVFGELNYEYGAAFLVVGFISTLVGQLVMQAFMKKYNRNSYIAYCIGLVVGISALAMTYSSISMIVGGSGHQGAGMCSTVHVH